MFTLEKHIWPHYDPYTRTIQMLTPAKLRKTILSEMQQSVHLILNTESEGQPADSETNSETLRENNNIRLI